MYLSEHDLTTFFKNTSTLLTKHRSCKIEHLTDSQLDDVIAMISAVDRFVRIMRWEPLSLNTSMLLSEYEGYRSHRKNSRA